MVVYRDLRKLTLFFHNYFFQKYTMKCLKEQLIFLYKNFIWAQNRQLKDSIMSYMNYSLISELISPTRPNDAANNTFLIHMKIDTA